MSGDGDFLSRWSRRKREARESEAAPEERRPPASVPAAADDPPPDEAPSEPALTEEEIARLPPVETITGETDLAQFLRKGVPAGLRKAALRRMWAVDPSIRDYVGDARDYAFDWNTVGGVPGAGPLLPGDDVAAMLKRLAGPEPDRGEDAPTADNAPLAAAADAESAGDRGSEATAPAAPAPEPSEPSRIETSVSDEPAHQRVSGRRRGRATPI